MKLVEEGRVGKQLRARALGSNGPRRQCGPSLSGCVVWAKALSFTLGPGENPWLPSQNSIQSSFSHEIIAPQFLPAVKPLPAPFQTHLLPMFVTKAEPPGPPSGCHRTWTSSHSPAWRTTPLVWARGFLGLS